MLISEDNETTLYEQRFSLVYPMAPLQYVQFNTLVPIPHNLPASTRRPEAPQDSEDVALTFVSADISASEPGLKVAVNNA